MAQKIHIVEDDLAFGKMLGSFLERKGFQISISSTGESARKAITEGDFNLVITDLKLPDDSGLDLLEFAQKTSPNTKVILMTGYAEVDTAVKAIKKGAIDYISKPFRPEELLMIIQEDSIQSKSEYTDERDNKSEFKKVEAPQIKPNFVVGISE